VEQEEEDDERKNVGLAVVRVRKWVRNNNKIFC
jgi:hypothetical protein